jgi:hypothetical protein
MPMSTSPGDDVNTLQTALNVLVRFLGDEALTQRIARLENDLAGIDVADIPQLLASPSWSFGCFTQRSSPAWTLVG